MSFARAPMRHLILTLVALLAACTVEQGYPSVAPSLVVPVAATVAAPGAPPEAAHEPVVVASPMVPAPLPEQAREQDPIYLPAYWPADVPAPVTTDGLCEPEDTRWPYPTPEQRERVKDTIRDTCSALGVSKVSCRYFLAVSLRESSYRPWVRHKREGDKAAAMNGYLRVAGRFGWAVKWAWPDRKQERIEKVELRQMRADANAWFVDPERWIVGGLGLGGVNVAYHLGKIDYEAPPEVLCDPVLNVIVQVTTARNAVDRYGARNWLEVQAVYAGRTYTDREGRTRPLSCAASGCPEGLTAEERKLVRRKDAAMTRRCNAVGLDCLSVPQLGHVLRGRGVTPEDRYELAEQVRGFPLPPAPAVPSPTVQVRTLADQSGS